MIRGRQQTILFFVFAALVVVLTGVLLWLAFAPGPTIPVAPTQDVNPTRTRFQHAHGRNPHPGNTGADQPDTRPAAWHARL